MKKAFFECHFDSIQALRAVCSVFIVLEHIRFLNCGAFCVDIFFIISGFMLMFSTQNNTEHYFRKRLLRILPLYYLMTFATYAGLIIAPNLFEKTTANPVFLMKSLLFIPFDLSGAIQPLVRVGWTVNYEMLFYLLFYIAFHINHKYRGLIYSIMVGVFVLAGALFSFTNPIFVFYTDPILLDSCLGILCFYIGKFLFENNSRGKLPSCLTAISAGLIIMIFLCLIQTKPIINVLGFHRLLNWSLPAMIIFLCFFQLGLKARTPRFLIWLGNISYSLYLTHYYPIQLLGRKVFDFSVFSPAACLGVIISMCICLILAWIVHEVIEHHFTNFLKAIFLPIDKKVSV